MKIDKKYIGFTLAEMMIVLVIVAIIVTVLTPMITKKRFSYTIPDTIWRANGSDIYFGLGSKQSVLIGGKYDVSNIDASLIVNTENNDYIPIMFNDTAGIYMGDNNKLMAGNVLHKNSDGDYEFVGNNSVLIRSNNKDELGNPLTVPSGNNNTIIGNYAFGYSSSMPNGDITGNNNTAIGTGALKGGYCSNCIAVGYNALAAYKFEEEEDTELPFNFMLNDTRDTMRAFGYYAGAFAKGGNMRAFGPYAGYNSVSPTRAFLPLHGVGDNYFLGYYAGALNNNNNTECTNVKNFNNGGNLYAGAYAGVNSCNSINNVSIGYYAGYSNRINEKIKSNNYNIGPYAGFDDTQPTEQWSSASSPHSMLNAENNINIGYYAGHRQNPAHFTIPYNFVSKNNINIGYYAGRNSNGERNIFIGTNSGKTNINDPTNSPIDNGYSVTDNKCIGHNSCSLVYARATEYNVNSSDTGIGNTGIGNTGIGVNSMAFGNGNYNTAIGYSALHSENSEESISVGVSGNNNTAIGYEALGYLTTGDNNTAIGHSALRNLTTGDNNTAIGYNACSNLVSGSNKTCIGNNTEVPTAGYFGLSGVNTKTNFSTDSTKVIVIGDENSKVYLGDAVVIGGADGGRGYTDYQLITPQLIVKSNNVYRWQPWWFETDYYEPPCQPGGRDNTNDCIYYSDTGNIIKVIHHKKPGGSEIHFGIRTGYYPAEVMLMQQQLHWNNTYLYNGHNKDSLGVPFGSSSRCSNPMCFELSDRVLKDNIKPYNLGLEKVRELNVYDYNFKTDEEKTMHVGVVAQELQKIFPYAVKEDKDGFLTIRTEDILYSSVNAVKQLHNYISGLFNEIVNLENKLSSLQIRKNTLKKENAMLKEKIAQLNARLTKIENKGK